MYWTFYFDLILKELRKMSYEVEEAIKQNVFQWMASYFVHWNARDYSLEKTI